jgi:hypothetical protein
MSDMIGSFLHIRGSEKVRIASQIIITVTIAHIATPWVIIRRMQQSDKKQKVRPVMATVNSPRLASKERSMICRILPRSSGMLQHFASPDPGMRVTSYEQNFLCMALNSFAVLHKARAGISVNTAPLRTRARPLKEKKSIAAIAGEGISGIFRAVTWTKKTTMKATKRAFGKQNEWILVIAKLGST